MCTCVSVNPSGVAPFTCSMSYSNNLNHIILGLNTQCGIQKKLGSHYKYLYRVTPIIAIVRQNIGILGLNLAMSNYNSFFAFLNGQYPPR